MPRYTRKQFWKLYPKLPQELKDALGSEETSEAIYEACKRNGILNHLEEIVELTGQVLLGLLLPQDFQKALEKEVKVNKSISQKVAHEINRFIFYPVRPLLEQLHRIATESTSKKQESLHPTVGRVTKTAQKPPVKKRLKTPDKYRESVK